MRLTIGTLATGIFLGFSLSRIGFSSWDEVHAMFTFQSLRLIFGFFAGALLLVPIWWLISRLQNPAWPARRIHHGSIAGGALFGIGWALSGACPSIALVQLGEGQFAALITLGGMLLGNFIYSIVHERYFRWPVASCLDE